LAKANGNGLCVRSKLGKYKTLMGCGWRNAVFYWPTVIVIRGGTRPVLS
jgi:hypothetical protein